jgi:uncharacterized membrane protein YesL
MEQQNKLKDTTLRFFYDLFDLMVVNWLWVLCCLSVVTIGPATCGLYSVTLKLAREEPVNPAKDFFQSLKQNFKAGLVLELAAMLPLAVAVGDLWFALQQEGFMKSLYFALAVLAAMLFLCLIGYCFALQAMFSNTIKQQILNSFKLALVAPGRTILIWVILLLPVIAALTMAPAVLQVIGFLYLVMGFSGPVYGASCILRNIFDRVNGASREDVPPTAEK